MVNNIIVLGTICWLTPLEACMAPLIPWKLDLREEDFISVSVQGLWAPCLKCMLWLTFHLSGENRRLEVLEVSWRSLTNNSKESLSYLVLEFLLDGLWILEGKLSAQVEKLNLNYVCVYTDLFVLLGRSLILWFLMNFPASLLLFCLLLPLPSTSVSSPSLYSPLPPSDYLYPNILIITIYTSTLTTAPFYFPGFCRACH